MNNIEKAIKSAKASLSFEGLHLTPEEEALIKARLLGIISEDEFKNQVLKLIKNQ